MFNPDLPPPAEQATRLSALGVPAQAGLPAAHLHASADRAGPGALLVVRDARPSQLAGLLRIGDRSGFVVPDMSDVDSFVPVAEPGPPAEAYLVTGLDRGDHLRSRSPDEAVPALTAAGRSPLTLVEGLHWLLQQPEALQRNHCFMTAGSRLPRSRGRLDARTPALWISNGTGRDGPARRGAPKVGWCWAGNRHDWLGFASAAGRW